MFKDIIEINGQKGKWYTFDEKTIFGKLYLFLESVEFGDEMPHIIYNYTDKKVMTSGIGISWLDLKDCLLEELEKEINKLLE